MKRNALKWSAGLIAGFAILLASCGTDYKIDTVLQLDKADVTAVAYPGVNVISWEPIASARNDYTVYVYEEDVYKRGFTVYGLCTYDTDIVNDKEYTYYVVANSDSDPSLNPRAVVVENSMGSDSVTAIVPPMGTKALDLVAYEDGYDGEVLTPDTEEDEYILTVDRVKTFADDAKLYISFPAKAYLEYTFKLYDRALDHAFYPATGYPKDVYSNNVVAQKPLNIPGAGKYQLTVEVTARGTAYDKTELVIGEFEFAKLGVSWSEYVWPMADYVYKNSSDVVVRIKLPKVTKADGSVVPSDWYKVYRVTSGAYETAEITSTKYEIVNTINNTESNSQFTYYLEDKVPDVNVSYTYYVVITDGKSYSDYRTVDLGVKQELNVVDTSDLDRAYGFQSEDKDYKLISGSVDWTIVTDAKKSDVKAYVMLGEKGRVTDTPFVSEIKTKGKDVTSSITEKNISGELYVTTVLQGGLTGSNNTAYLLVVVNEAGKKEAVYVANTSVWFK